MSQDAKAILAGFLVGVAGWMLYERMKQGGTPDTSVSWDMTGADILGTSEDGGQDSGLSADMGAIGDFVLGAFWMGSGMKTSLAGIELIKRHEGFRGSVYDANPPQKDWTIGYGHKLTAGESFTTITEAQATALLMKDLADAEDKVNRYCPVPLTQNQFDALVSFAFNVTTRSFLKIAARVKSGKIAEVPSALQLYVFGGGVKLAGLVARRADEARLFSEGVYA